MHPARLDPVSLRLFVAVMEHGSIAAAAEREHIAASALSRRLAELETALNVELFGRSNRGVEPTAAAYALQHRARGLLNEMDDIALQMRDYASGTRGQVRVAANNSAITQFLPAELQGFLARYPQVDVRLQEQISTSVARAVAENAADVGILNDGHYGERVVLLPYHKDELVVVPAKHPLSKRKSLRFADVLSDDFIGLHPGSVVNNLLMREATQIGRPLKLRMQVTSYDAQCLMISAGLGVGVLPRGSARLYRGSITLSVIKLAEPWAMRQLALCVHAGKTLTGAAQLLVEHLRASAQLQHDATSKNLSELRSSE